MKKILIAVPCMDQVAAGFAQSLATLNKVGQCSVSFLVGSLIYDSRNKLAAQAVKMGADFVLWLDSDMTFNPDTLERLCADIDGGRDIVSGLYFRRAAPYTPVAFSKIEIVDDHADFDNYSGELSGIHEVAGVGFGCVLISTDVFIDCFAKYGTVFSPIGGLGEDLAFCWRARQQGYKVYLDTDIKCGHVGHVLVTEDFYTAFSGGQNDNDKS